MDRAALHRQLAPEAWHQSGLSQFNKLVCALILLASLVSVLETEPTVRGLAPGVFTALERVFVEAVAKPRPRPVG
ncbi:hypothetical protein HOP52_19375 [Halomonas campisalis]|uniref:Uncharacterized protein n=1 Tax=Billgrantia campisalis TaxID=74661 RepID=A0ABS9PDR6_9GAMM|nr:hypothetical protein [Halomonas campisalis]MCG6659905.1 hypothetical protein [Halomonas campisalis]MDR5865114.1 hypothetical protein [Halomonas campisalis]